MSETSTKVINDASDGLVRFSYLNIWEPKAAEGSTKEKYSVMLIIPKTSKKLLKKITDAVDAAAQLGIVKLGGKIPPTMKRPLRDGDLERPDDKACENCYFMNASSDNQPGIVDENVKPIMDRALIYSGCYGRVSLNFYAFNTSGNKGVAVGLNNIQKLQDGERLDNRASAEDDFSAFKTDSAASLI